MTLALELAKTRPHDQWLDREIVRRVLRGRFDLVHRPLSKAEMRAIIAPVLEATVEATKVGENPPLPMATIAKHFGFAGPTLYKIIHEVCPDYEERMKQARSAYVSFHDVASGHIVDGRRVARLKADDPEVKRQRRAWKDRGMSA